MAPWIRLLDVQAQGPKISPQYPCKKLGYGHTHVCYSSTLRGQVDPWGLLFRHLVNIVRLGFSENPCVKGGRQRVIKQDLQPPSNL